MFNFKTNFRKKKNQIPGHATLINTDELMLNPRVIIKLFPNYWEVVKNDELDSPANWTMNHLTMGEYLLDSSDPQFLCRNIRPMSQQMRFPFAKGSEIQVKGEGFIILDVWFAIGDHIAEHWDPTKCDGENIPYFIEIRLFVRRK